MFRKIFQKYFELVFWLSGISLLALSSPGFDSHYSLCLFKLAGIGFCPGCGLGRSITFILHGNLQASFMAHPLGFFAIIIIGCRVHKLVFLHFITKKYNKEYATGEQHPHEPGAPKILI